MPRKQRDWKPMPLDKWERCLVTRLRSLRNKEDCGIIAIAWSQTKVSIVTKDKGPELLER